VSETTILKAAMVEPLFEGFVAEHGEQGEDRTNLVDLLADLMHLAKVRGIDFADALASAENHFSAESSS